MARAYVDVAAHRPGMFELVFRHDLLKGGGENRSGATLPATRALDVFETDLDAR